jgi:DNA-binding LacI/PurR family transcriptional regulator/DNA-binding transcriptional ArsR family regulator
MRSIRTLRQWIENGELTAGDPLPAENELAQSLKVSRTTVRAAVKALEDEGLISTGPNRRRFVAVTNGRSESVLSDTVAIITHLGEAWPSGVERPIATGWERNIQLSVIDSIRTADLHALTLRFDRIKADQMKTLITEPPRGLVLMRPSLLSSEVLELAQQLRDKGVPVVCYGYSTGGIGFDSVASDHNAGCKELCRWLIQKGCRRLLRVWDRAIGASVPEWRRQRDAGYVAAVEEAGLEILPPVEIPSPPEAAIQSAEDFELRARLALGYLWPHLSSSTPVDAILAVSDGPSYPIAAACRMLGKEPNRDVTIVGYDNYWPESPLRRWESSVPAATIDKMNFELGQKLVELLLERANGTLPSEAQLRFVTPELRVIEQTAILPSLS